MPDKKDKYVVMVVVHAECGHPCIQFVDKPTSWAPEGEYKMVPCSICEVEKLKSRLARQDLVVKRLGMKFLGELYQTSRMFAYSKEALIAYVCGVMSMAKQDFDVAEFYQRHLDGAELGEEFDDVWARFVIDDALDELGNNAVSS